MGIALRVENLEIRGVAGLISNPGKAQSVACRCGTRLQVCFGSRGLRHVCKRVGDLAESRFNGFLVAGE